MKIEVLEEKLKSKDRVTGINYSLEKGDRVTVSESTGRRWCDAGWVEDLSGDYPTGKRVPGARRIAPDSTKHEGGTNG